MRVSDTIYEYFDFDKRNQLYGIKSAIYTDIYILILIRDIYSSFIIFFTGIGEEYN